MADLYRDFVFTRNTVQTSSSDTQIQVEDVSLFPSNALLAKSEFYVAFESTLSYPHSFEIVRITSIDTTAKILNVVRAQAGTTAVAHSIVTYIKGTLTSDMLRRARSGLSAPVAPTPDADIFLPGDRFFNTTDSRYYIFTGRAGHFVDTFTRAVSTTTMGNTETIPGLGSGGYVGTWNYPTGIWGINAAGQAYYVGGSTGTTATVALNLGGTDFDVSVDQFHSSTAASSYGVYFRSSADLTYGYYLQFLGTTATFFRVVNGVQTSQGTTTFTAGTTANWRVIASGTSIQIFRDRVNVLNLTETLPSHAPTNSGFLAGANFAVRLNNATALGDTTLTFDNFRSTYPGNTGPSAPITQGWTPSGTDLALTNLEQAVANIAGHLDDVIVADTNVESTVLKHDLDIPVIAQNYDDMLPILQEHESRITSQGAMDASLANQLDDVLDTLRASATSSGSGPPTGTANVGSIYSDTTGQRLYVYGSSGWVQITYAGPGAQAAPLVSRGVSTVNAAYIPFPTGTAVGDLAVVGQIGYYGTSANLPITSGYSTIYQGYGPNSYWCSMQVSYKILTSGDITAGGVTVDNPSWNIASVRTYGNAKIDASGYQTPNSYTAVVNTNPMTAPSVTTTAVNDIVISFFMGNLPAVGAITGPTGHSNVYSGTYGQSTFWSGEIIQATAGASPTRTGTFPTSSGLTAEAITVAVGLVPAPVVNSPVLTGTGVPTVPSPTTLLPAGELYLDTASNAIYVYTGTFWAGVTGRVVKSVGDYSANGGDYILADASSAFASAHDVSTFSQSTASPATVSQTTTQPSDLIVGIRATWNNAPTGFTATLDGSSMTRRTTVYSANTYFAVALFTSDTLVGVGSHSVALSGSTSASTAWNGFLALSSATTTGATYFTSDRNGNFSFTLPATGPGVVVFYAMVVSSTAAPVITSSGGLTFTSRGSGVTGGVPSGAQQWTAPYSAAQAGTTISMAVTNDTTYGSYIGACFPGGGDPTTYDASKYSVITLPSGQVAAKVIVQNNDQGNNLIRVAAAGGGLINGSATYDSLSSRYQGGTYMSDGTNWFKIGSSGGGVGAVVTKTAAYTAKSGDAVLANATTAAFTVTLPTSVANATVSVKKTDSTGNAITIAPTSGLIDGLSTKVLSTQYDALDFYCDGTNWWIF